MLSQTYCALCREVAELRESHVLPAFVYRWLKDTSITGYLRAGENPRKRVQDGLKRPLLCARCEGRFNRWETAFATEIFHPYNANNSIRARYGDWMLKFCTSVSWRALAFFLRETGLKEWTDEQLSAAHKAMERWRAVMLGEVTHPGPYEQHILPLGPIKSSSITDLPENMNRYFMRGVEIDAAHGEISAFTYAKMGRFAVFGIVRRTANPWRETRVRVKTGVIGPSEFVLPHELANYLMDRARRFAKVMEMIPDHQLDRIETNYMRDPERVVGTDEFAAMLNDARMFGLSAILRKPNGDNA